MKKVLIPILVVIIMIGVCAVLAFVNKSKSSVYASYKIPTGTMRMIAHQGYSAVAPGNTLPSYEAAGKSDFWGAECDIQRTKDGVWILSHNDDIEDMTDGTGLISEQTYAELMEFNVDTGNNIENYPNLKLTKLEDYLDVCKQYGLHPVIEIKENADTAYLHEVADILSAREEKDMFHVISGGREICTTMKELMPTLPVYYIVSYEEVSRETIEFAVSNHLDGMDIHVYHPEDYVKDVVASGLDVFVWTIDDMGNCKKFYKLGVNAITTNSITQEPPAGNFVQRCLWALRDSWYQRTAKEQ